MKLTHQFIVVLALVIIWLQLLRLPQSGTVHQVQNDQGHHDDIINIGIVQAGVVQSPLKSSLAFSTGVLTTSSRSSEVTKGVGSSSWEGSRGVQTSSDYFYRQRQRQTQERQMKMGKGWKPFSHSWCRCHINHQQLGLRLRKQSPRTKPSKPSKPGGA